MIPFLLNPEGKALLLDEHMIRGEGERPYQVMEDVQG